MTDTTRRDNIAEALGLQPMDAEYTEEFLDEIAEDTVSEPTATLPVAKPENDGLLAPAKPASSVPELPDLETDYQKTREVMLALLEKGTTILDRAMETAKELDTPRGHEVASKVLKELSEITSSFYDVQKKTKDLKQPSNNRPGALRPDNLIAERNNSGVSIEKAVFVGTTADLLKRMKEKRGETPAPPRDNSDNAEDAEFED